ncbi:hypothetical protein [Streptomyces sp. NPDC048603]|uniref:hypothetical protein n=1 Tax=Streptomyces sp. NPDC048603 TaxID=3365577 RepID=UPI0037205571
MSSRSTRYRLVWMSVRRRAAGAGDEYLGERLNHRHKVGQRNAHADELRVLRARVAELEARLSAAEAPF